MSVFFSGEDLSDAEGRAGLLPTEGRDGSLSLRRRQAHRGDVSRDMGTGGGVRLCMYTDLNKTLATIGKCLTAGGEPATEQLHRMYDLTQRLLSQELAITYDLETYVPTPTEQEQPTLTRQHASGRIMSGVLILTIREPLPAMNG